MSDTTDPKKMTVAEAARLRVYGYHFAHTREDLTRCAVETTPSRRGDHPTQCSRPRGHGPDGLLCKQHAKAEASETRRVPQAGGWGRHMMQKWSNERVPLAAAAEKLADLDARVRITQTALKELEMDEARRARQEVAP